MKLPTLFATLALPFLSLFAAPASAGYVVDVKIGEIKMPNSGAGAELAALQAAANAGEFVLDFYSSLNTAQQNAGAPGEWFLDTGIYSPGFFLLKFGIGGTGATANTFIFKNVGEMSRLVWRDAQVQFLSGSGGLCDSNGNIGRLSHYRFADVAQLTPVPEPVSLALVSLALLAMTAMRRKR